MACCSPTIVFPPNFSSRTIGDFPQTSHQELLMILGSILWSVLGQFRKLNTCFNIDLHVVSALRWYIQFLLPTSSLATISEKTPVHIERSITSGNDTAKIVRNGKKTL